MNVIVREAAYDDLDGIYAWIGKDDPRAADAVAFSILESAKRLGRFPYIGHPGSVAGTYEWLVNGLPYVLVYRVKQGDDLVLIEAIFHTAQQYRR
jgi:toxin ParE1/3/4